MVIEAYPSEGYVLRRRVGESFRLGVRLNTDGTWLLETPTIHATSRPGSVIFGTLILLTLVMSSRDSTHWTVRLFQNRTQVAAISDLEIPDLMPGEWGIPWVGSIGTQKDGAIFDWYELALWDKPLTGKERVQTGEAMAASPYSKFLHFESDQGMTAAHEIPPNVTDPSSEGQ